MNDTDRVMALMDQEGCAGCAEEYAAAHTRTDRRRVIDQAIRHIYSDGYSDGQAQSAIAELRELRP